MSGDRVGAALAGVALIGATLVGIALVDQRHPAAPPLTLAVSAGPPAPPAAGEPPAHPPAASPAVLPSSVPVLLTIPALGVSSPVRQVGLAADGTVAVPPPGPTYDQAAWYRYSPAPGSRGPALIVGHVDSAAGGPSVFFHLGSLERGDQIDVTRADGLVARFAVDDVRRYRKTNFPTAKVYGNTPDAALRLVTCGGPFDRSAGHYLDNIVVTASMLPLAPGSAVIGAR